MTRTQAAPGTRGWAFITGGTRGIGRGLVEAFAAEGREVVFTYLSSVDSADGLVHQLALTGARATGHQCDCTDEAAVATLAATLVRERGAPAVVINNAGVTQDAPVLRMTSTQWHEVIRANLDSAFFVTRHFVESMVEAGDGVILQMSSVTGIKGNPGQVNYAATKAGMVGMTRTLALELARFNVRVNAVLPGFIETEMVKRIPEAQLTGIRRGIPMRRMGRVEEVAAMCRFLASTDAGYVTGQTFVIDGGLTA
jgi:3-oxoacyl-[acyl-carrier protein] reductase